VEKKAIDLANYESYYLDYIEGVLSPELTMALELFLAENPELVVEPSAMMHLSPIDTLDEETKQLMKNVDFVKDSINVHNCIPFFIASAENILSEDKKREVHQWASKNKNWTSTYNLYTKVYLNPNDNLVFSDKYLLKKNRRLIHYLWYPVSGIAAAAIVAFIFWDNSTNENRLSFEKKVVNINKKEQSPLSIDEKPIIQESNKDNVSVASEESATKDYDYKETSIMNPAQAFLVVTEHVTQEDTISEKMQHTIPVNFIPEISLAQENKEKELYNTQKNNRSSETTPIFTMNNPIHPITNGLAYLTKQDIDFQMAKPNQGRLTSFFLKIGKLEITHIEN
jgi:hypothetical protein